MLTDAGGNLIVGVCGGHGLPRPGGLVVFDMQRVLHAAHVEVWFCQRERLLGVH